jgi:hypothetical protein
MSILKLDILSQHARDAVACSYCFKPDRAREWNRALPRRPQDRSDDVALAPWIGPRYSVAEPRVAVVMLNPGHAPAPHKLNRGKLGRQLRDGEISYEEYNAKLTDLVPKWGFGGIVRWLDAIKLDSMSITFLNVALCAVANDEYFRELFEACFARHTRNIIAALEPHVVLLCGKKELKPYVGSIESLGTKVILTWRYRPMNTGKGKIELQRVRAELEKLAR